MRGLFLIFGFLLVAISNYAQIDLGAIDAYLEKARKEWNTPGMAVGLIINDTVLLAKGYGTLSSESDVPVDTKTLFGIASNTKAFTTAALATLVDDGKLRWDDKVIDHLPWFKLYDDYVTNHITIRDIVSHRTGLKTFSGDLIWYNSDLSRKEVIEHARFLKPAFGFRARYGYSNIMYLVAGEIIQAVSGKPWEDYVKEKFFEPLEMSSTNTSVKDLKKTKNVAEPHMWKEGKVKPIPYIDWYNIAPAGAINSNVEDMLKWLSLQLNRGKYGDKVIFSEEQSREMWLPQTIDNVSHFSERLHPSKHFSAYGLGWDLFDYYGYKIVNHSGGLDGMVSHTFMIPEIGVGGVVLTNTPTTLPYAVMHQMLEFLIGDPSSNDWSQTYRSFAANYEEYLQEKREEAEKKRNAGVSPTFDLKDYAGLYSGNVYGNAKVSLKKGKLYLELAHTPTFKATLEHWEADVFEVEFKEHPSLPKGTVTFVLDKEKTRIMEMIIDVPNPDFDFTELDFNKVK